METLNELFEDTLKDIYFAENEILKALPKMAKKATSEDLKKAFTDHAEETKGQVKRLEQIFKLLGKKPEGKECHALKGLAKETEELMEEAKSGPVLDAGLIACAQAVEHYEMARYGALSAWAEQLDMEDASELLEETLDEEKAADEKLSGIADDINPEAEKDEGEAEDDDEDEKKPKKAPAKV
ncbi:MAG: ferritin-like domain-containing protein [Hyphomicrobiaceae bacterium]|jgi:ferritin-like metal-binding protein YciE